MSDTLERAPVSRAAATPSTSSPASKPITLAEVQAIIADCGPILRLHPDEKYLLDDPQPFLATGICSLDSGLVTGEDDYDSFNMAPLDAIPVASGDALIAAVAKAKQNPQAGAANFRYWLRIDDSLKPGNMARARAQVRVVQGLNDDMVDLQFWFFYGFNGPGKFHVYVPAVLDKDVEMDTAGRHYGDWEHVTLRMHRQAGAWKLHSVYLSRHTFTTWVSQLSDLQFSGNHPIVYSARDSHAHYQTAGQHVYETPWHRNIGIGTAKVELYDLAADGGQAFDTSQPNHSVIIASDFPDHGITAPAWTQFDSMWGQYEKLIYSFNFVDIDIYDFKEVESGPHGPLQHTASGLSPEWSTDNIGEGPGAVCWLRGNFSGDGDSIVQGWGNHSSLGLIHYTGDGCGGLVDSWHTDDIGQGPGAVCWLAADIDGNGRDEIVQGWGNGGSLGMIVYGSDGGQGLKTRWATNDMGQGPGAVCWLAADIDGDGKDEIIQGWGNGGSLGMIVYGSDGGQGLKTRWSTGNMGEGPGAVCWLAADLNGDGKKEIIQGWGNGSSLGMIVYGSDGGQGLKTVWSTGDMGQGPGAVQWLVADLNGDGKDEIIQAWANGSSLGMIVYGSDGAHGLKTLWSTSDMGQGPGAVSWTVADINGDGKDEIVQAWANGSDLGMIVYGDNGHGGLATRWASDDMGEGPGAVFWLSGAFVDDCKKQQIVQGWGNGSSLGLIVYSQAME